MSRLTFLKVMNVSALTLITAVALMLIVPSKATAIPSFGRQVGVSCDVCHTTYPELTPFGRNFKLTGYTMSSGEEKKFPYLPLSGMVLATYSGTKKSIPEEANEGTGDGGGPEGGGTSGMVLGTKQMGGGEEADFPKNRRALIPELVSIYYGGRILPNLGAQIQVNYDRVENTFHIEMTDIRFANITTFLGKSLIYGLTLNNNPTVQDVWNSTPVFGFPFLSSSVVPTPMMTKIDMSLASQVGGLGAYAFWNDLIYGEFTLYRTTDNGITQPLGAGEKIDNVVKGVAPYWRFALQREWDKHSFEIGTYGLSAKIFPTDFTEGPAERFTDIAFDAQYQFIGDPHIVTLHATYIHEKQNWDASYPMGSAASQSTKLKTFKANAIYSYKRRIVGAIGYFSITGSTDEMLYTAGPITGSRAGSPDSRGFVFELDCLPFKDTQNTRVGVQYTAYSKFNGAKDDYDSFGRNASDNNTLFVFFRQML